MSRRYTADNMYAYDDLTDEQLASQLSQRMGIEYDTALRAVVSDDPDLGRDWAKAILSRMAGYQEKQARLTEHRESLRKVAAGG